MTHREPSINLTWLFNDTSKAGLRARNPPAAPTEIKKLAERALSELGQPLSPEYLQLVELINGSGYDVCFYPTHTRTVRMLKRNMRAIGIVEKNLELRKMKIIGTREVAYAQGEGSVFMPASTPGSWIGRNMVTKVVEWQFVSFDDLLRKVYR